MTHPPPRTCLFGRWLVWRIREAERDEHAAFCYLSGTIVPQRPEYRQATEDVVYYTKSLKSRIKFLKAAVDDGKKTTVLPTIPYPVGAYAKLKTATPTVAPSHDVQVVLDAIRQTTNAEDARATLIMRCLVRMRGIVTGQHKETKAQKRAHVDDDGEPSCKRRRRRDPVPAKGQHYNGRSRKLRIQGSKIF